MSISPNGRIFAIFASNCFIYIFNLSSGKIILKLDETIEKYIQMGNETKFGIWNFICYFLNKKLPK